MPAIDDGAYGLPNQADNTALRVVDAIICLGLFGPGFRVDDNDRGGPGSGCFLKPETKAPDFFSECAGVALRVVVLTACDAEIAC